MDAVRVAVEHCKSLTSAKDSDVKAAIAQISSLVPLLEQSSPSKNAILQFSGLLRNGLKALFLAQLPKTLNLINVVLKYIHNERIVPLLHRGHLPGENNWDSLLSSLISGILDYLEQHATKKAREAVASSLHSTLSALYFGESSSMYGGKLLANVYLLLRETVESPGADPARLRDKHIGSRRLGQTIVEIKNYLALESILDLFGRLVPPLKSGKEKRSKFLHEVFDSTFKGSQRILRALETIPSDWTAMVTRIIYILAETDIGFPQPFEVSLFEVQSALMTLADALFVDRACFLINLDMDGNTESLEVPFNTIKSITLSASSGNDMKVTMKLNMPPIMGSHPMSLPQQDSYLVSYNIPKTRADNFGNVARSRGLAVQNLAHKKLSKTPSQLLPDIGKVSEDGVEWRVKAEKLTNMAKHGTADAIGPGSEITTSSPAPLFRDGVQSHGILEIPSDGLPAAVFVDGDGNFSIHPPKTPIHVVSPSKVDLDQKHATFPPTPPPATKQSLPSQDEVVSQPKRRPGRSKPRTIIVSDDEDAPLKDGLISQFKQDDLEIKDELPAAVHNTRASPRNATRHRSARPTNKASPLKDEGGKRLADRADIEGPPPAKRARQTGEVPHSPVVIPDGDVAKHVRASSPAPGICNAFDYVEAPKPTLNSAQPRARAMKGKDGKQAVKPRPISVKRNTRQPAQARPTTIMQDEDDADKTLVDHPDQKQSEDKPQRRRSLRGSAVKASIESKSTATQKESTRSRKSNKAPWTTKDFVNVKQEVVEDEISLPAIGSPAALEETGPDMIASHHDIPPVMDNINVNDMPVEDRAVKQEEPSKAASHRLSTPSPLPEAKPERVVIDLSNSPYVQVVKKPGSMKTLPRKTLSLEQEEMPYDGITPDRVVHAPFDRGEQTFVKNVERLPLPRAVHNKETTSIQMNRHPMNIKIEKLDTPMLQTPKMKPGKGDSNTTPSSRRSAALHSLNDVETTTPTQRRVHVELSKSPEQEFQERTRRNQHRNVYDPDSKIIAILDEITQVVSQRAQRRFTNISSHLRDTKKVLIQGVVEKLQEMHYEGIRYYNDMVDLHETYTEDSLALTNDIEGFKGVTADLSQNYKDMAKDIRQNGLCRNFPKTLVPDSKLLAFLDRKIKINF